MTDSDVNMWWFLCATFSLSVPGLKMRAKLPGGRTPGKRIGRYYVAASPTFRAPVLSKYDWTMARTSSPLSHREFCAHRRSSS